MTDSTLSFENINLTGEQASKFLQGQITADVAKLTQDYQLTSICNLKGKVNFGFWLAKLSDTEYNIVISADCAEDFIAHVKKYGAFSRLRLSEPSVINPIIDNDKATFSSTADSSTLHTWSAKSIAQGQWVITQSIREKYQPQELRLHQIGDIGGVHYDKGCYLGQEVVARIWFKSAPKAWLHRVKATHEKQLIGDDVNRNIKLVNMVAVDKHIEALVVAMPKALAESELEILPLPDTMQASVAREKIEN